MKFVKKLNRTSLNVFGNFQKIWTLFSCPFAPKRAKMTLESCVSSFSDILVDLKLSLTREICPKPKSYQFTGFWELSKNVDICQLAFCPQKDQNDHRKLRFIIFGFFGRLKVDVNS